MRALVRRSVAAVASVVGFDEVLILVGLVLVWYGLLEVSRAAAFAVPGAVILWLAVPPRKPFIVRPERRARREG